MNDLILKPTLDDIGRLKPFVAEAAEAAGVDGKIARQLRLAVEEALVNIVRFCCRIFC